MDIVYSATMHPLCEGRVYQNPRFFSGPLPGAQSVLTIGVMPAIAAAYAAAGVPVTVHDTTPAPAPVPPIPSDLAERVAEAFPADPLDRDGRKGDSKPGRKAKAAQDEEAGDPPLTRREIEADLTAADADFDPAADLADLREQRDAAKGEA